jgi:hypothetical protein
MSLSDHPYFPYPRDAVTRFGFLVGDIVSGSLILLILYITLKATLRF